MRALRRARPVADAATRPSTVVTAFWLAVATAVASLVINGIGFVVASGVVEAQVADFVRQGLPRGQAQTLTVVTFALVIGVTIAYSVLLGLFAQRMRRGRPSARIVTTVLCAISLLTIVGFSIGAIAGLLAAFAIVFAWLPASSDWFRSARRPAA